MVLPIINYKDVSKLRFISEKVNKDYPDLNKLINNMWDTLLFNNGVGLAAPQVDNKIRLFIINFSVLYGYNFKKVFINPIIETYGHEIIKNEMCLSIPNLDVDIIRYSNVRIKYYDENWEYHDDTYGKNEKEYYISRIIQHENDHLNGKLIIDNLTFYGKMEYYIKNNIII